MLTTLKCSVGSENKGQKIGYIGRNQKKLELFVKDFDRFGSCSCSMKLMAVEHPEDSARDFVAMPSVTGPTTSAASDGGNARGSVTNQSTAAIEAVYRSVHERLWKSLLAFTGDPEIASDAEAETFTQALARGGELRDPAAWVWRSAFRIATGMMADRNRSVAVGTQDQTHIEAPLVELLSMLESLSDQQRAIVVLRYAAGFRPAEIAQLLDTSPTAVSVQLHRSHGHLRKKL